MVLEKSLESPLDGKEIKPVNPKGNQSWIFIGRTDAKAETPILWPPHAKNWLIHWKRPWCWEGWGQEEKGRQRMRWLDGITDSMDVSLSELQGMDGQGGLACCDSWGCKEWDTTEQLNWTELIHSFYGRYIKIKRWERGSGWGTRVHPWRIHVDVWQNQYNIVK